MNFAAGTYQIGTIEGNTFEGFVTAINLSAATGFKVDDNDYNGCSNNVINPAGTANSVGVATP